MMCTQNTSHGCPPSRSLAAAVLVGFGIRNTNAQKTEPHQEQAVMHDENGGHTIYIRYMVNEYYGIYICTSLAALALLLYAYKQSGCC